MNGSTGMDVVWQDSVGSFLDWSGTDPSSFASFASDVGGTLWSSSGDSPVFSGQSVLWESGPDAPADSHISALTADSASGTDTSALLAGSWIADTGAWLAGGSAALDGGLLWAGAGSDTSSSLTSGDGVGLGALDLGASSGASLWQPFADQFASGWSTSLADAPHLLWTGAGGQPSITVPAADSSQPVHIDPNQNLAVAAASQPLHIDPNNSLAVPSLASVSPAQLTWTQPSGAAAPTTWASLVGDIPSKWTSSLAPSSSNLPPTGAGGHA